jgi:hypothetical protein
MTKGDKYLKNIFERTADFSWVFSMGELIQGDDSEYRKLLKKRYSENSKILVKENFLTIKQKGKSKMITINRKQLGSIAILTIFFAALILILSGCSDSSITGTNTNNNGGTDDNVSVSLKSDDNAGNNPQGSVVITEAKALVTEVEFEKEGTEEEVELHGPAFVIHFDLNGGISQILSTKIPAGNFTKVKFQIHKPEDTETIPDNDFREGTSGNQRYSFIIKGTYNGNAFVYKSRKSANLVINFNKTISLQNSSINLTMLFNKLGWFRSGQTEIDPRDPQHENEIDDNLKNSFKEAFEDNDHDGRPDDH